MDISNYLNYPATPIRKGVKNSRRKSFVISSNEWIQAEEKKKEEKVQKQTEKENKVLERAKKTELKEKEIKEKKEAKLNRRKKVKNQSKPKLLQNDLVVSIFEKDLVLPLFGKERVENEVDRDRSPNVFNPLMHYIKDFGSNKETHVRKMFPLEPLIDLPNMGHNIAIHGQMCYHCTFVITKKSAYDCGIKCTNCIKSYHIKCLEKLHMIFLPVFLCNTCSLKNK